MASLKIAMFIIYINASKYVPIERNLITILSLFNAFFSILFLLNKFCIHSIMFLLKRNMAMDSVGLNEILFFFCAKDGHKLNKNL